VGNVESIRRYGNLYKILRRDIRKHDSLETCRPRSEDNSNVDLEEMGSEDTESMRVV
jgi:hypothetical protein